LSCGPGAHDEGGEAGSRRSLGGGTLQGDGAAQPGRRSQTGPGPAACPGPAPPHPGLPPQHALLMSFFCVNKHCCRPFHASASIAAVLFMHEQALLPSMSRMSKLCCCPVPEIASVAAVCGKGAVTCSCVVACLCAAAALAYAPDLITVMLVPVVLHPEQHLWFEQLPVYHQRSLPVLRESL